MFKDGSEGGLRAPERSVIDLLDPEFWNKESLDKELRRQFDVCHGCRRCFNLCESFPRLFDIIDNSSSFELDTVDSNDFQQVIDACTLCDMCFMVSCPYVPPHEFGIDIPSLIIRARAIDYKNSKTFNIDKEFAKTDRNGEIGTKLYFIFNMLLDKKNRIVRYFMEKLFKIDRKTTLPKYNNNNFKKQFSKINLTANEKAPGFGRKAIIFLTCYANYNDSNILKATINVLSHNGVKIEINYTECCKMPQLEQGDVESVKNTAINTAKTLIKKVKEGNIIIAPIASCAFMIKSHWPLIANKDENVKKLSINTMDIDEYVMDLASKEGMVKGLNPIEGNITVHNACHSRAQKIGTKSFQMLKMIPDTKISFVDKCSGHGGTWGTKKNWNKIARKHGKSTANNLLKKESKYIASSCPLASLHISDIAEDIKGERDLKNKIYHPIELLKLSYKLESMD